MRKLGLIGGMSWLSTRTYYEHINRLVQAKVGRQASAPLLIESLDYSNLQRLQTAEQWRAAGTILADSAARLEAAGATAILIGANAMHKVYDQVAAAVTVAAGGERVCMCVRGGCVRMGGCVCVRVCERVGGGWSIYLMIPP